MIYPSKIKVFDRILFSNNEIEPKGALWLQKDTTKGDNDFKLFVWNNGEWRNILQQMWINKEAVEEFAKRIDGFVSEDWVESQGYLKEQDLFEYAKKSEIPSLEGYATEQWVEEKGYLTEHQHIKTINNTSLIGDGNITIEGGQAIDAYLASVSKTSQSCTFNDNNNVATTITFIPISTELPSSFSTLNIPPFITYYMGTSGSYSEGFYKSTLDIRSHTCTWENILSKYLPLSGGTLEGPLNFKDSNTSIYTSPYDSHNILNLQSDESINFTLTQYSTICSIGDDGFTCNNGIFSTGFFETSDIRKKNIHEEISLEKAYALIDKCQTILYDLKDDEEHKLQLGMIAQEVEKFFPEIVSTSKDDTKSLDYSRLTVIVLRVLKDVINRLSKLEKK